MVCSTFYLKKTFAKQNFLLTQLNEWMQFILFGKKFRSGEVTKQSGCERR